MTERVRPIRPIVIERTPSGTFMVVTYEVKLNSPAGVTFRDHGISGVRRPGFRHMRGDGVGTKRGLADAAGVHDESAVGKADNLGMMRVPTQDDGLLDRARIRGDLFRVPRDQPAADNFIEKIFIIGARRAMTAKNILR